jgi:hypothetical protein
MAVAFELLPITTVEGDVAMPVVQEICESVDTSAYRTGVVTGRMFKGLSCDLYVEGSDDGQTFVTVLTLSGAASPGGFDKDEVQLNQTEPPGSAGRLYRILRWRLDGTAGGWEFCGRVGIVLK